MDECKSRGSQLRILWIKLVLHYYIIFYCIHRTVQSTILAEFLASFHVPEDREETKAPTKAAPAAPTPAPPAETVLADGVVKAGTPAGLGKPVMVRWRC